MVYFYPTRQSIRFVDKTYSQTVTKQSLSSSKFRPNFAPTLVKYNIPLADESTNKIDLLWSAVVNVNELVQASPIDLEPMCDVVLHRELSTRFATRIWSGQKK